MTDAGRLFLEFSRSTLAEQYWPRMRQCVESLTPDQIWWRPNAESNSIGNLMLHLNGNVRQWVIDSFSGSESLRDRPAEFAARDGVELSALVESLGTTVREAAEVIGRLTEADLLRTYDIQGYAVTGVHAVYHVVEHFGMHYGQIVYITKQLRGEDLGFYRELNQTGRVTGSQGSR
jgi:uncharacterized damage-inducible protein DinB